MLDKQCEELAFSVLFPKSTLKLDPNITVEGLEQTLIKIFSCTIHN